MRKLRVIYALCSLCLCLPAICRQSDPDKLLTECFFPGGKAIGQPFTSKQAYIRMVRVSSFDEAYAFCRRLYASSGHIEKYCRAGYSYYRISLPENKGYFLFTDKVIPKRNEVAILWVKVPYLIKQGITELHFVETIKIKKEK